MIKKLLNNIDNKEYDQTMTQIYSLKQSDSFFTILFGRINLFLSKAFEKQNWSAQIVKIKYFNKLYKNNNQIFYVRK